MHELPQELTSSLRSFRGSIYGSNRASAHGDVDLELGERHGRPDRQNGEESAPKAGFQDITLSKHPAANDDGKVIQKHDSSSRLSGPGKKKSMTQRLGLDAKGAFGSKPTHATPNTPAKMSIFHAPPVHDPDPAADRLADDKTPLSDEDFHQLMGMRKPGTAREEQRDEKYPFKLATKHGLYRKDGLHLCITFDTLTESLLLGTICDELRYIQYKYRIFDVMTYVLLALQIAIGAVFIILGALRDARTYLAIAVLGAISTVIGGVLALMKGQGLPNRLRQARDQMRNVVFEAEELYWDFRSGRAVIYADIKKIREDYLRVLEEMRKNHPDTWTNAASQAAQAHRGRRGR